MAYVTDEIFVKIRRYRRSLYEATVIIRVARHNPSTQCRHFYCADSTLSICSHSQRPSALCVPTHRLTHIMRVPKRDVKNSNQSRASSLRHTYTCGRRTRPFEDSWSASFPISNRFRFTGLVTDSGRISSFYRAMHFSAKRGIAIACRLSVYLSLCLSVTLVDLDTAVEWASRWQMQLMSSRVSNPGFTEPVNPGYPGFFQTRKPGFCLPVNPGFRVWIFTCAV